ncbi:MAG: helix-turn-helix transcriptional regulator [Myxococcota bacterium]
MTAPDDETLQRLAGLVARIGEGGTALPSAALVALGALADGAEVTVDYQAKAILGHPLVVWRPAIEPPSWWAALTPREAEVAALVADGLANAAIARRLGLAIGTVKDHVHRVLSKARLRRRSRIAAALGSR